MMELLTKMTVNPARLYQFDCGDISEGRPADLVIFDPDEVWQVEKFASRASNSPFLGAQLCERCIIPSVAERSYTVNRTRNRGPKTSGERI